MLADYEAMRASDEGLGGGDPFEGILERIDDLDAEIKRRAASDTLKAREAKND